jgi:hypothetical protein
VTATIPSVWNSKTTVIHRDFECLARCCIGYDLMVEKTWSKKKRRYPQPEIPRRRRGGTPRNSGKDGSKMSFSALYCPNEDPFLWRVLPHRKRKIKFISLGTGCPLSRAGSNSQ